MASFLHNLKTMLTSKVDPLAANLRTDGYFKGGGRDETYNPATKFKVPDKILGSSGSSGSSGGTKTGTVVSQTNSAKNASDSVGTLPANIVGALNALKESVSSNSAAMMQAYNNQNQIAMDFNAAEAAKNRDWQEMMSNTAHQREVADLKAAGLNPILSATGGNGAAVTSGATAAGVSSGSASAGLDTGLSNGLAGLLGTIVNADASIQNARTSAAAVIGAANASAGASYHATDTNKEIQDKLLNFNYDKLGTDGFIKLVDAILPG